MNNQRGNKLDKKYHKAIRFKFWKTNKPSRVSMKLSTVQLIKSSTVNRSLIKIKIIRRKMFHNISSHHNFLRFQLKSTKLTLIKEKTVFNYKLKKNTKEYIFQLPRKIRSQMINCPKESKLSHRHTYKVYNTSFHQILYYPYTKLHKYKTQDTMNQQRLN